MKKTVTRSKVISTMISGKMVSAQWKDDQGFHLFVLNKCTSSVVDAIMKDAAKNPGKYQFFIIKE